jgi:putative membrane protein
MKKMFLFLACSCLFFIVNAQNPKDNYDAGFIRTALMGGLMEVQLGRMAQTNGASQQVKDYGRMIVNDHSRTNAELNSLAKRKNIASPENPESTMQATMDKLSLLKGGEFDRAFMNIMVENHLREINLYKAETYKGKDPDVRNWAARKNPVLQKHLDWAERIKKALK